jgi:DNA-binding GntR family transcriptional regulator
MTDPIKRAESGPSVAIELTGALAPIERRTLHEIVYARLKKALLSGHLEPGRVITLRGLALDLGTSVMPVREAVGRLVSERAFELLPNRCIRIPQLSAEQADELWRLRIQLEGEAAGLAALRVTDAELERIRTLRDRARAHAEAGEVHSTLDANDELQFCIYRASRSDLLVPLIETLRMRCAPHCTAGFRRLILESPPFLAETIAYDFQMVAALERRDARAATLAKRRDLTRLRAWIESCAAGTAMPEIERAARVREKARKRKRRT